MAVAKQRQEEGLPDIHHFILNKSLRSLTYLIDNTSKSNKAPEKVERKKKES